MNVLWHPDTKQLEVDGEFYEPTHAEGEVLEILAKHWPTFCPGTFIATQRNLTLYTTANVVMAIRRKCGYNVIESRRSRGYRIALSEPAYARFKCSHTWEELIEMLKDKCRDMEHETLWTHRRKVEEHEAVR